jgi:hypothetical protein
MFVVRGNNGIKMFKEMRKKNRYLLCLLLTEEKNEDHE